MTPDQTLDLAIWEVNNQGTLYYVNMGMDM